ncbi:MAG: hypothetical protein ACYC4R_08430 [Anaerolineae bacterium]
MNDLVCKAIQGRLLIAFRYSGGERLVEPYVHGVSTAGHEVIRGYQVSGYSASGRPTGWKQFRVEDMADLELTNRTFTDNRPGYQPSGRGLLEMHCHL